MNSSNINTYILFKNEFYYFIYEAYFIFSLFFLLFCGIILSSRRYSNKLFYNFYNVYIVLLTLIIVYGLLMYSANTINYNYCLFLSTYNVDSFIFIIKILFFVLLLLFLFVLKIYANILKLYN